MKNYPACKELKVNVEDKGWFMQATLSCHSSFDIGYFEKNNSEDKTLQNAAFHHGLHCLLIYKQPSGT